VGCFLKVWAFGRWRRSWCFVNNLEEPGWCCGSSECGTLAGARVAQCVGLWQVAPELRALVGPDLWELKYAFLYGEGVGVGGVMIMMRRMMMMMMRRRMVMVMVVVVMMMMIT
jgi:hypothetical protein